MSRAYGLLRRGGGGSGSGLTPGPLTNEFTGATPLAARNARDAYATANPDWLAQYDQHPNFYILLLVGSPDVEYHLEIRRNSAWVDANTVIRGPAGPRGLPGTDAALPPTATLAEAEAGTETGLRSWSAALLRAAITAVVPQAFRTAGNVARLLPSPASGDADKIAAVNSSGDGYVLVEQPSGGGGGGGNDGEDGDDGWSPEFAVRTDGARRVLQVSDWQGGSGAKPAAGQYVGAAGLTATITAAVDIRGPAGSDGDYGTDGTDGTDGWSPEFAVVSDGARRVLQVSDWTGGGGTKPTTGQYVGATGLTATLASGVDIRGPQGPAGGGGGGGLTEVSATAPLAGGGTTTDPLTIANATASAAGAMSSTDKGKLDSVAQGAEVNPPPMAATEVPDTTAERTIAPDVLADVIDDRVEAPARAGNSDRWDLDKLALNIPESQLAAALRAHLQHIPTGGDATRTGGEIQFPIRDGHIGLAVALLTGALNTTTGTLNASVIRGGTGQTPQSLDVLRLGIGFEAYNPTTSPVNPAYAGRGYRFPYRDGANVVQYVLDGSFADRIETLIGAMFGGSYTENGIIQTHTDPAAAAPDSLRLALNWGLASEIAAIGLAAEAGTALKPARVDHVHEGIHVPPPARTHTIYALWSTSTSTPAAASWTGAGLASSATEAITLGTTAVDAYLYIGIPTSVNGGALTTVRQAGGSLNQRSAFDDANPATLQLPPGAGAEAHTIYRSRRLLLAATESGVAYVIG